VDLPHADTVPPAPVPPAAPLSFLRYIHTVRTNAIAAFHADLYQQWIVETKLWKLHTFIVNDPAGIRHVLVDNADNYVKGTIEQRISLSSASVFNTTEEWRERRHTMSSVVDCRSLAANASIILESTQALLDRWRRLPSGSVIEISGEMSRLTLEVISRIIFSADSAEMASVIEQTIPSDNPQRLFDWLDFSPLLDRPWAAYKRYRMRRRLRGLTTAINRILTRRSREKSRDVNPPADLPDDLLDRLMRERDPDTSGPLTAEEIQTQIITMIGAGHQTTAIALAWIWYLLALHPSEEARLHAELDHVLQGRPPCHYDIPCLPFTRMVIEESLRLYPPFHTLAWRGALADDEVCGVKIPRGATVTILPWVLHRHARLWDHPERFDPERFSPKRSRARSRYAYLPFGTGPRICIGASFAMTQMTLILATVAQRCRLRLVPGHPIEPQGLISLRPRYGVKVTLENR
jgi:cytochrome P450